MKEEIFIERNGEKWQRLESFNHELKSRGVSGLKGDEIQEFINLYRTASHHLAHVRTHFPGGNTEYYLNQLVSVSHNYIFVREKQGAAGVWEYLSKGFPRKVSENSSYILTAFGVFMTGVILFWAAVMADRSYGDMFFKGVDLSQLNLEPDGGNSAYYPLLSSFITTNNIRVCFLCFTLGITGGLGTLYVLFYNGLNIGALSGIVMADGGSIARFLAMILPHGFIELAAIFISGGAGLMIGRAILIPGGYRRRDAAIKAGKEAAYLIPGVCLMLIIAGLIEGFFTPLGISYIFKLIFSAATFVLLVLYFITSRAASRYGA